MNEGTGTTQRRLTRSSSSKVIAGVAGGLAEYTGLDPVIFRIGLIALAIAGGSGILVYLLAWLVIPEAGTATAPASGLIDRLKRSRWVPIVLIGIAVVILIESIGAWGGPGLWALALIGIGIALLQDEPEPVETIQTTQDARSLTAGAPAAPAVRAPRVRRRRSPLGAYTFGATLLVIALAAAATGADLFELDLGQFLGLALLTLGVGLIVGGWWGRARLLMIAGLLVVPFMLAASALDVPLRGSFGDRYVYGRSEPLERRYELLAGSLNLDLSKHRFGSEPRTIDIDFVIGNVDVWVPPGVEVTANVEMDGGSADVFGEGRDGTEIAFSATRQKEGLTEGELILNVQGGIGSFDASWANWIDKEKQRRQERQERQERKEAERDGTGSRRDTRDN